jgi:glycosyltransferase involved in cell wall biosynthesis
MNYSALTMMGALRCWRLIVSEYPGNPPPMSQRLLLLIHSLSMGGAERVATNLANHWVNKGYTVAVATLSSTSADFYALDPRIERIALDVAKPSQHPMAAVLNNLRTLRAVRRLLKQWQPQVTIALMTNANVYLALAGWGLPGQKIGSEQNHPPMRPLGRIWEMLRRLAYGRLDHLVALTAPSAAWLRNHTRARHVTVIGNPVPWPLPVQPPVLDPNTLLIKGRQRLIAAGRLVEQKGFDLLIEAFARLAPDFQTWDLIIVGEGPLRGPLEAQLARLDLQGRVFLVGAVGNIGAWYMACDLYVMSSRFEGFGNTLAEALACGLPAVSFDCETGPSDIIRPEIDGLLVPPGDVSALVASLTVLMTNQALRERFAIRAVEARARFSVDGIAGQWERLFQQS